MNPLATTNDAFKGENVGGGGAAREAKDLEQVGIPFCDEQGRYADFHSLRYSWATHLQRQGVNSRMAMELIIRKHRSALFYHALGIVKDGQEAYDIVQEVFIRAMRERRFFTPEFRMKAWLFRVTSNLCFNRVRDRKRRGAILETVPRAECAPADQLEQVFTTERRR